MGHHLCRHPLNYPYLSIKTANSSHPILLQKVYAVRYSGITLLASWWRARKAFSIMLDESKWTQLGTQLYGNIDLPCAQVSRTFSDSQHRDDKQQSQPTCNWPEESVNPWYFSCQWSDAVISFATVLLVVLLVTEYLALLQATFSKITYERRNALKHWKWISFTNHNQRLVK